MFLTVSYAVSYGFLRCFLGVLCVGISTTKHEDAGLRRQPEPFQQAAEEQGTEQHLLAINTRCVPSQAKHRTLHLRGILGVPVTAARHDAFI